jgi:hypothetical protein
MHREQPAYPGPLDGAADAEISAKRNLRSNKKTTTLGQAFERPPQGIEKPF